MKTNSGRNRTEAPMNANEIPLPRKPDPGRDRNAPRQDTGHPHLPEPEVLPPPTPLSCRYLSQFLLPAK